MGIRHLSSLLRDVAPSSMTEIAMSDLNGRRIAVDTSIYMYRFLSDDALMENMYLMISLFRKYNIVPIFIFDGYPSDLKYETILERKQIKESARLEYDLLNSKGNTDKTNNTMRNLKRKIIKISDDDFNNVKNLLSAYGMLYFDAPGEADSMIAKMVQKKLVWAVLSDDTDYFAYGCGNILRYLSLSKETMVLYDLKSILTQLKITQENLREICVLAGTDYNKTDFNIHQVMKFYERYKRSGSKNEFYTWLDNEKLIDDYKSLITVYSIYENTDSSEYNSVIKKMRNTTLSNRKVNIQDIKNIMIPEGFVFI